MKDRELLLRYMRRYSKDETVIWLKQELKKAETELGVVKSERDEARDELSICRSFRFALEKELTSAEERKLLRRQYSQDEYVSNLKAEIFRLRKQGKELKTSIDRWQNKYFDLVARNFIHPEKAKP